ncbi:MAG: serine/threonine-protein kinase, partial [Nannocystaceae bacterium]
MTTVATDCPPPSSVVEYVEGTQKPGERLEFEEHMDGCQACLELVATLASLSVDPTTTGQDLRGLSAGLGILRRGENVGRYLVLEVLGAGGMGVIYSAYDPELDRRVALKLLHARERAADGHPTADSRDDAARLTREARAMARLSHRNVIAVYDVGTFEGHVYITMECIEGVTLRTWCQSAKRPWREVVDVFCRAGRGLAAAHAAGLVHHDFKPSNVMVSEGRVVVLDFGLAREHHNTPPQSGRGTHERAPFTDVDTTSTGVVIGTPAYMSPEQRVGRRADARSDQYSFCLALTEALLGVPARGSATVDNTIPAPIRTTLRRGLSEDPGARFP